MNKMVVWALGMMSGTSMDGIDVAMISTDGHHVYNLGKTFYAPYTPHDQQLVQAAMTVAQQSSTARLLGDESAWPDIIQQAQECITQRHIECLVKLDFKPDVIGFHGQTLVHRPDENFTLQIGNAAAIAQKTGIKVVSSFRQNDMRAAGGQGAPLAPFYHFALAKRTGLDGPIAFLNIGGVANVTWVNTACDTPQEEGALLAFDTGAGNALLNDWMLAKTGQYYDADGNTAARGTIDIARLRQWSQNGYFDMPPPKSLDRDDFKRRVDVSGMSVADGAATLTAFSVYAVERALTWMPAPPVKWLVCGGGRHNATMMKMLADKLESVVVPIEDIGIDGDQVEAQAFGYLAVRRLNNLPLSAPSTTGCRYPVTGGNISRHV